MKHDQLTLDEHRRIAVHLYAIKSHTSEILRLTSGKVPLGILRGFTVRCSGQLERFRSDLEGLMFKQLRRSAKTSIYYGHIDARCNTNIVPRAPGPTRVHSESGVIRP